MAGQITVLSDHKFSVSLLMCLLCTLFGQAWSAESDGVRPPPELPRLVRFKSHLEQLRHHLKIPGLSAAIIRNQSVIWAEGLGFADLEHKTPATPDTPYRIASLTKTFTSTLIMQLVEQGRLNLDEPMMSYSQYFQDANIRVRHVLTHTSSGTPGDQYQYQGGRFNALTTVLEKVSGKPFRNLLAANILDELQMTSSVPGQTILAEVEQGGEPFDQTAINRYQAVLDRLAQSYTLYGSNETIASTHPPARLSAATGLISTVMDLAKFDAALDRHLLLTRSTQEMMFTPTLANNGQALPYGLGWFVQQHRRVKLIWHYGYWRHTSSFILKIPQIHTTLILLANSDALSAPFDLAAGDVMRSPVACLFMRLFVAEDAIGRPLPPPTWAQPTEAVISHQSRPIDHQDRYTDDCETTVDSAIMKWLHKKQSQARRAVSVNPALFQAYIGRYAFSSMVSLMVFQNGNRLYMHPTDQPSFELFPASEATFFPKAFDALFVFVKNNQGRVTHVMLHGRGPHATRQLNRLDTHAGSDLEV